MTGRQENAGMLLFVALLGLSAVAQAERYAIPWFVPAEACGAHPNIR